MNMKLKLLVAFLTLQAGYVNLNAQIITGKSPAAQPYPYLNAGKFTGPGIAGSPDPLVNYRWPDPKASDGLEIYLLRPKSVATDQAMSFTDLQTLAGENPDILVKGTGSIRIDFGLEMGAWIEFDSPDCPGGVEMSISEYNEPGIDKTAVPVKYGNTYRLELNPELYDGVRFAWIHVRTFTGEWRITGIRAVCQVKPTNYNGSFSCSDPVLTRAWYMSAYGVKASLCRDYFGAILMERGDRMSWTGDAHTSQAAALVAFANYDFIRKNIDNTSDQSNGIRSYSLYWVLSLLDYYDYTGDAAVLNQYIGNACKKLDDAYAVFGTNPKLRFYGWDERLCAGFEIWFKESQECQNAYKMLSIRAWQNFSSAMGTLGQTDLKEKYEKYANERMAELRNNPEWLSSLGLHAAADAVNTGLLTATEQNELYNKWFTDRVNRLSISPFNQYFILQSMARMNKFDEALTSVRDLWGGMAAYGGTTPFETYRPSWNLVLGPNDAVPNTQSGLTSLCHPWGAGVVKWLSEEILGFSPTSPGFKTYDVVPHPGGTLKQISGEVPTPYGNIAANFDFSSGECMLSAPLGTVGRIGIPNIGKIIRKITINGKLAWDGTFHQVQGISASNRDSAYVFFTGVNPGTYHIAVDYFGTSPGYVEEPETYAAEYVKQDTATGGDWGGIYGTDGFILCNYHGGGSDKQRLPPYVSSLEYFRAFPKNGLPDPTLWAAGIVENRALAPDRENHFPRNAACYSNSDQTMTVTIGINGIRDYQIALYFLDWENGDSRLAVEMFDAVTLNLISPVKLVRDFSGGTYLVYSFNKSVKFRFDKVRGATVTLSGIFFDPKLIP